jgi:hypothetical protein
MKAEIIILETLYLNLGAKMYSKFLYGSEYGAILGPLSAGSFLLVRKKCRNFDWLNDY